MRNNLSVPSLQEQSWQLFGALLRDHEAGELIRAASEPLSSADQERMESFFRQNEASHRRSIDRAVARGAGIRLFRDTMPKVLRIAAILIAILTVSFGVALAAFPELRDYIVRLFSTTNPVETILVLHDQEGLPPSPDIPDSSLAYPSVEINDFFMSGTHRFNYAVASYLNEDVSYTYSAYRNHAIPDIPFESQETYTDLIEGLEVSCYQEGNAICLWWQKDNICYMLHSKNQSLEQAREFLHSVDPPEFYEKLDTVVLTPEDIPQDWYGQLYFSELPASAVLGGMISDRSYDQVYYSDAAYPDSTIISYAEYGKDLYVRLDTEGCSIYRFEAETRTINVAVKDELISIWWETDERLHVLQTQYLSEDDSIQLAVTMQQAPYKERSPTPEISAEERKAALGIPEDWSGQSFPQNFPGHHMVSYRYTPEKAEITFAADNALDASWSYRYQEIPRPQFVAPSADASHVSSFLFRGLPVTQIEENDRFLLWWEDDDETVCIVESQRRPWTEVMEFVHLVMSSAVPS